MKSKHMQSIIIIGAATILLGIIMYQAGALSFLKSNELDLSLIVLPEDYYAKDGHLMLQEEEDNGTIYIDSNEFYFRSFQNLNAYNDETADVPYLIISSAVVYDTEEQAKSTAEKAIEVPLGFNKWIDVNKRNMTIDNRTIFFSAYHPDHYVTQIDYYDGNVLLQITLRSKFDYYDKTARDAMRYMIEQLEMQRLP